MKKIVFSRPFLNNKEILSVNKVIKSGWLTSGKLTQKFEKLVQKKIQCNYALAVNSCTNGIFASIIACGIKSGDEVITSAFTYVSTINTLFQLNLKIKLCDINLDDYSLDTKHLERIISKKTKLIIITHYGGVPTNTKKILNLCKKYKIFFIQDAATTLGAKVDGKYVGSEKNIISVFSLYANKIITSGEGGIITTNKLEIYKKLKKITYCGIDKIPWSRSKIKKRNWFYKVDMPGYKFNYTDLQSAIAIPQLKKLETIINYRNKLKLRYKKNLLELEKDKKIKFIREDINIKSSNYIFTILLKKKNRDLLFNFLTKNKIQPSVHYIPANKHFFYKKKFKKFNLKNTNCVFNNIISLPFHNYLTTKDIDLICLKINSFFKKK